MGLPLLSTYSSYAYQMDLIAAESTNYIAAVRSRIDLESLSLGDSENDSATGPTTYPGTLVISRKKRGVWPRHIVVAVKDTGATKSTLTKLVLLTQSTANQLLSLGDITTPGDITFDGYGGTITLISYAQEYYFRIFEEVISSSSSLRQQARAAGVKNLENIKEIRDTDLEDYKKLYRQRQRELKAAYEARVNLPNYSLEDDL